MALDILFMWCRAKQKADRIGGREGAKGGRSAAAASATVATSAPRAAPQLFLANGHASSSAPAPPLMPCGPPNFENKGGNGDLITVGAPPGFEHKGGNGRRFGYGGGAATKQLPNAAPGLPVPLPAQSTAPGAHTPVFAGTWHSVLVTHSCPGLLLPSRNTMVKARCVYAAVPAC